jgi:hypothetical protein
MLIRRRFWLLWLSLCLFFLTILPLHFFTLSTEKRKWEVFDPALVEQLRSVESVLTYTDSLALAQGVIPNTLHYGVLLNNVIKRRFYHGYSHYSLKENWIAAVAGKLFWYDLSAIVLPDDLLNYPMAACSQQSIVFIECLRRKGISVRNLGFDHHFAVEGYFDGWYYFDPNIEPDFSQVKRASLQALLHEKKLPELYKNVMSPTEVEINFANPVFGKVNILPAANAGFFHKVTKALSKNLWLLPFAVFVFTLIARGESFFRKGELNGTSNKRTTQWKISIFQK